MWDSIKRLVLRVPRSLVRKADLDEDDECGWLYPPDTVADPGPWDEYWRQQLAHGVAAFGDIFCNDGDLIDVMRANGLRTVLCLEPGPLHGQASR
jgi:hypothetical protein